MKTDVLIVGGGLAGLNAAAELRERFPELVCTVADCGGGASSEIMGFCAPVERQDSPEQFYRDILRAGDHLNSPELAQVLARRASGELERLEKLGIRFDRDAAGDYAAIRSVGSSFPRVVHSGTTTGRQALKILAAPVLRKRVVKLVVEDRTLRGALLEDGEMVRCKAVILAGGGFAGLWKFSTWSKQLRGDCLVLAEDAGCELCNLGSVQFEPTVTVYPQAAYAFPVITTVLHEGARLYGADGKDLVSGEIPAKRVLAERIQHAIDAGLGFPHGGVLYDFSGVDEQSFRAKYPEYHRKYLSLFPSFKEVRFEVRPAAHTTLGGIRIGADASAGIPGIFAAGEAVGNLHGADRLGGNAGLEVFVFGRIAGASAGRYAVSHDFGPLPETPPPPALPAPGTYAGIAEILDRCFTVLPKKELCEEGIGLLRELPPCGIVGILEQAFRDRLARSQS